MSSSNTDKVQENLKKFSAENVDAYIQASTFTEDIQDVILFFQNPNNQKLLILAGYSSTYSN
jgi:hypothetical protein